ncbi:hypothetical protein GQX74_011525 [Glossina fuscipes]|nr:hypothetical protein GQX74_011525 [Glossina fuscipes]
MEEFSGTGGHLDFGRSISLGSNPALPLRPGSTPTPGLRYKNLGKSGLRVSNVGLGTWPVFSPGVSDDQAEAILKLAIESGINLFDISEAHSETEIGKILQRTGWKRTAYVITTKVYWSTKSEERGLSRKHIIECVKASLQRLQLQYIDIVIIHKADAMCPMEEIVRAMNYIIQQGWAMYWGTARWSQVEIMEAYTNCRQFNCITPIVEQSEYHMFCREKCELYLPEMYNKIGVGLMAWGPLSMALSDAQNGEKIFLPKGSFKTKSQSYSWTEDEINKNAALSPQGSWSKERLEEGRRHSDRLRDLAALAEKLGCTPTQLSIAWSLKHEPVQCLLLGATSAEQLHQSLQSLQLLPRLSTSVMLEVERILENKPGPPSLTGGVVVGGGSGLGTCGAESPKNEEEAAFCGEEADAKDASKQGFCESLDNDNKFTKAISSKTSLSSTTMTTTISKHDLLWQQQQQQRLSQQFINNSLDNATITTSIIPITTTKANRLDSNVTITSIVTTATTTLTTNNTIPIDSLNNNNLDDIGLSINNNNIINTSNTMIADATGISSQNQPKLQKKKSLLNFKSLDFHLKSLYTGLKNGTSNITQKSSQSQSSTLNSSNTNDSHINVNEQDGRTPQHQPFNRMPPYLKIDIVDNEEAENLLIDYPKSPYSSRRNSSHDDHRSSSQLIHLADSQHLRQPYDVTRSPSPYFLSPHIFEQNIRRSSTSDIMTGGGGGGGGAGKRSPASSVNASRRPSTSDLLRRARERRGSEQRMGRSVSHSGLPRGGGMGYRPASNLGGRRTSMAF